MSIKVANWSTTPASNTSVDGVAIGENCPFANMNNMGRAIMAAVKYEVASFGTVIAAAATPDIAIEGGAHTVTGTTTITGFQTAPSGLLRVLHFETATPVAAGANLALPGGLTSISFVKGGVAKVRSLGSAAWKMEWFDRGDGKPPVSASVGKHKLWIPAAAMRPATTNGPASADVSATQVQYYVLDFDQSTIESAHFNISMPSSWNEGTITFVPIWTAASGSGDVVWQLLSVARSNDDAIGYTYTTSVTSTDTLIAADDLHRGPESSALTVEQTPAANDTIFFVIRRTATSGSDTFNADARLIGIELYITTDAAVDAA